MKRRSFQTGGSVWSFGISEGNITGKGKKKTKNKKPTEYAPNHNSQWISSPDTHIRLQQVVARQGDIGGMFRVRTGPECPEDNMRELT